VKNREVENLFLFYTTIKEAKNTACMEFVVEPIHIPHITDINNSNISQGLELSVIPYIANQPTDS